MKRPPHKASPIVSPARFEAFTLLMEVERSTQAHADDLLRSGRVSAMSVQDRNLCTALVMGTLRWQLALDARIRGLLAKPNARLDPAIRIALRMGAFQLLHLDRIPPHAAISESVNLAKLSGHTFAARMVNAVLRMIAEAPKAVPDMEYASANELAEAFAHPTWLVERWTARYGLAAAHSICEQGQRQPEIAVRLGSVGVEEELAAEGVQLAPGALLKAARRVVSGDVTATAAFRSGRVRIQEEGSQLIAESAGSGAQILDCCAAPGGKTMILAERNRQARITACELSPARLEALRTRLATSEYAAQIELRHADATELEDEAAFDLVLADVPCSGTGTLGRNPEIRHRLQATDLTRHHARQCAILRGALKAGSHRVIYSTCSLEPEENAEVVAAVLADATEWKQVSVASLLGELRDTGSMNVPACQALKAAVAGDGSLTLIPGSLGVCVATDGFFIAVLEKVH